MNELNESPRKLEHTISSTERKWECLLDFAQSVKSVFFVCFMFMLHLCNFFFFTFSGFFIWYLCHLYFFPAVDTLIIRVVISYLPKSLFISCLKDFATAENKTKRFVLSVTLEMWSVLLSTSAPPHTLISEAERNTRKKKRERAYIYIYIQGVPILGPFRVLEVTSSLVSSAILF